MKQEQNPQLDLDIKRAAQLSLTEICLGSIGHGFKIPLTGQILSLNQLGFLLNAVNRDKLPKSSAFEISGIAAILKSFSPAGQKLGPMLSIAMQGFLFWLGISIFGLNLLGQALGAVLLSLWAFIQPFITLFMIYGFDLLRLIDFYMQKINEDYSFIALSVAYAVISVVILKVFLSIGFVIFSLSTKKEISLLSAYAGQDKISSVVMQQISGQILQTSQKNTVGASDTLGTAKLALKDLFKPLFLLSFILMLIFVWQINGSFSQKIWLSLRPLAIAFILFYILRSAWVSDKFVYFSKRSKTFARVYLKSKAALELIATKIKQNNN